MGSCQAWLTVIRREIEMYVDHKDCQRALDKYEAEIDGLDDIHGEV